MTRLRGMPLVLSLVLANAALAVAQWNGASSFAGGAALVGAQGFARPPITSAVAAAYAHVPVNRALLVGAQAGTTFMEPRRAHASYAIGTVAYAQRRGVLWQVYPFLGMGAAAFRTRPGDAAWRPAFAAGFGIDVLAGAGSAATMLGARIGYITRSLADDESVAYAAVGLGFGGRGGERHEPRTVANR